MPVEAGSKPLKETAAGLGLTFRGSQISGALAKYRYAAGFVTAFVARWFTIFGRTPIPVPRQINRIR